MDNEAFISRIRELFGNEEFSVSELVTALYNRKPRSDTPEYKFVTAKLRYLEKKEKIFSRKIGNLKRYCLEKYKPEDLGKEEEKIEPEDYIAIREMVILGFKTGRIPLSALNRKERLLLDYLKNNIVRLIKQIKAPYSKVIIRKTPSYIEIIPSEIK